MTAKKITLSIPKPCHEDWDQMSINERGRHCANCNKTVVDFSLFTEKELVEFFKTLPTNICGHIPAFRLDTIMVEQQPKRFPWLRNFAWGTAIASWLGLSHKASAQTDSLKTIQKLPDIEYTKGDVAVIKVPVKTEYLTLSFYDESSKALIDYVNVTMNVNGTLKYYSSSGGVCKIPITSDISGQKVTLSFSNPNYDNKDRDITVASTSTSKNIYLKYHPHHTMVNGGMVAHPINQ